MTTPELATYLIDRYSITADCIAESHYEHVRVMKKELQKTVIIITDAA